VKTAGHVDSLTGKFFADSVGPIHATLNKVFNEVGAVKRGGGRKSNDRAIFASH
jgi:hypothetical protein